MAGFLTETSNIEQWLIDSENVFSEKDLGQISGSTETLKSIFNDLYNLYKENLKAWWEYRTFEN